MTDSQKFDIIMEKLEKLDHLELDMRGMKGDMQGMKDDMRGMKDDMQGMKLDMQNMKDDMQGMKDDMQGMKDDMQGMKLDMQNMKDDIKKLDQRVTSLQLHVENSTDRNIQLLAENFIELTNKLNKAIPAADKNLAYEVKVNYLVEEVQKLKIDVAELKSQTA